MQNGNNIMEKEPITSQGLINIKKELDELKNIKRPKIIEAIAEARAHGDLKENAEYHAARERQSFIEGRLAELEGIISRADVIDTSKLSGETVRFGATVMVADEDTDEEITYKIVGSHEADIDAGRLSITAPLARALIGKTIGDSVAVITPGGDKSYEVCDVRFD